MFYVWMINAQGPLYGQYGFGRLAANLGPLESLKELV